MDSFDLEGLNCKGFTVVRGLFSTQEVDAIYQHARSRPALASTSAFGPVDSSGMSTRIDIIKDGDPLFADIASSERLMIPSQQYLNSPIVNWRVFVNYKEPKIGGSWLWHQDYWGWSKIVNFGYRRLISCHIALTPCTNENSCIIFSPGVYSHLFLHAKCPNSNQIGIPDHIMNDLLQKSPEVAVEMEPGDVLFFDSFVPHRSNANLSEFARCNLACVYATTN